MVLIRFAAQSLCTQTEQHVSGVGLYIVQQSARSHARTLKPTTNDEPRALIWCCERKNLLRDGVKTALLKASTSSCPSPLQWISIFIIISIIRCVANTYAPLLRACARVSVESSYSRPALCLCAFLSASSSSASFSSSFFFFYSYSYSSSSSVYITPRALFLILHFRYAARRLPSKCQFRGGFRLLL